MASATLLLIELNRAKGSLRVDSALFPAGVKGNLNLILQKGAVELRHSGPLLALTRLCRFIFKAEV